MLWLKWWALVSFHANCKCNIDDRTSFTMSPVKLLDLMQNAINVWCPLVFLCVVSLSRFVFLALYLSVCAILSVHLHTVIHTKPNFNGMIHKIIILKLFNVIDSRYFVNDNHKNIQIQTNSPPKKKEVFFSVSSLFTVCPNFAAAKALQPTHKFSFMHQISLALNHFASNVLFLFQFRIDPKHQEKRTNFANV